MTKGDLASLCVIKRKFWHSTMERTTNVINPSVRGTIFASTACLLAILAGIMAANAFAGNETYCNNCTLGSGGVPAVSSVRSNYSNNTMTNSPAAYLQIYNYASNGGVTSCEQHTSQKVTGTGIVCRPTTATADARCHQLRGTQNITGYCEAGYSS